MVRERPLSRQSMLVVAALAADASTWRHGYDLARQTGLRSGTLYPILIRLAERGLVEARWEDGQPQGRPRRHLYRLTDAGSTVADAGAAEVGAAGVGDVRAAPTKPRTGRRARGSIALDGAS